MVIIDICYNLNTVIMGREYINNSVKKGIGVILANFAC